MKTYSPIVETVRRADLFAPSRGRVEWFDGGPIRFRQVQPARERRSGLLKGGRLGGVITQHLARAGVPMSLPTKAKRAYIQSVVRASSDLSLLNPAGVCAPERGVSESRPCQGSALVIWVRKIATQKTKVGAQCAVLPPFR